MSFSFVMGEHNVGREGGHESLGVTPAGPSHHRFRMCRPNSRHLPRLTHRTRRVWQSAVAKSPKTQPKQMLQLWASHTGGESAICWHMKYRNTFAPPPSSRLRHLVQLQPAHPSGSGRPARRHQGAPQQEQGGCLTPASLPGPVTGLVVHHGAEVVISPDPPDLAVGAHHRHHVAACALPVGHRVRLLSPSGAAEGS